MTVRFTMTLGSELNDFAVSEAKRMGITKTAFIAMCIDSVKDEKESKNTRFVVVDSEKEEIDDPGVSKT